MHDSAIYLQSNSVSFKHLKDPLSSYESSVSFVIHPFDTVSTKSSLFTLKCRANDQNCKQNEKFGIEIEKKCMSEVFFFQPLLSSIIDLLLVLSSVLARALSVTSRRERINPSNNIHLEGILIYKGISASVEGGEKRGLEF